MKILLVEDDVNQLQPLQGALSKVGHVVDCAEDGEIAEWLITHRNYDLLILDWMLPKVSGISLCQQYRQARKTSPVLMLTAKDTILDKVSALDVGADDYLVKPFSLIELLARVRALGRRAPLWQGDTLELGDLQLDLTTLTVQRQEIKVQLSGREFQLLEYFLRHPRQILTHDQIEQALWEWNTNPDSKAITMSVHRLRQRLQMLGAEDWLQTVYGIGYQLTIPESCDR